MPNALSNLVPFRFPSLRGGLDVDRAALSDCERDWVARQEVAADFAEYRRLQVRGTPTYLIHMVGRDGARTRVTIAGAQSLAYFQRVIDDLLASAPEGSADPRVPPAPK